MTRFDYDADIIGSTFEIFWRAYPVRIAKKAAFRAFKVAIRETTLQVMLDKIEQYKVWLDATGTPPKHPATWLNGGCWDDELELPEEEKPTALDALREAIDVEQTKH